MAVRVHFMLESMKSEDTRLVSKILHTLLLLYSIQKMWELHQVVLRVKWFYNAKSLHDWLKNKKQFSNDPGKIEGIKNMLLYVYLSSYASLYLSIQFCQK